MKLSIGGYSFYNTFANGMMDVFGYLETVKHRYNLNAVDMYNRFIADNSKPLLELADESYIRKVRQALDEKELQVVNYAADAASIWDEDPERRELLYQNALKNIRASEILGAKTIRIDTGGAFSNNPNGVFDQMSDEQFEHIVKRYQEYAKLASNFGAIIGPENHTGPSLNPHFMKKIAEAVDHENYGVLLHVDRWKIDPEVGDAMVAPYAYHIHFGGNTLAQEEKSIAIAQKITASGFDAYWAVEHNGPGNQYIEVEWTLAAMKKVLKNVK
ncbi:TIM barrel protein [Paenibacillus sp. LMG 31456]|uniref:TIM barrel protein n=1 Tax=Paenibacillus foliorum TaxID=2654974 RepID=A0A972K0Q1_9BACL|nr:TIM barrel protein [Paenibacillus foliorum]NOU93098.1 TIM barrel protein [Paenibacillus foliorum]